MIDNEFDELFKACRNLQDFDEESFYDKVIMPKVKEVYELCQEHNIPAIWYANPRSHGNDMWTQYFVAGNLDRMPPQFLVAHRLISAALTLKLYTALKVVFGDGCIPDPEQELPKIDENGRCPECAEEEGLKEDENTLKNEKGA